MTDPAMVKAIAAQDVRAMMEDPVYGSMHAGPAKALLDEISTFAVQAYRSQDIVVLLVMPPMQGKP